MITPRKALFAVALVLLLCALVNARWTGWLTRPTTNVVETTQWPAGWVASNFKTDPPGGSSITLEGEQDEQIAYLKERLERADSLNEQLRQANQQLQDQIETYDMISLIRPIDEIRLVEARVAQYNAGNANPTMKLLRGSLHGVKPGDAVIYKADLLGFVTDQIGPANATVSLITRADFEIQVHFWPPKEKDAGEGWPLVDRVNSDGEGGFYCDLRTKTAEALRQGDVVRVADNLRESANGFVLGEVQRIGKHPTNPTQEKRVYILPRTPIGPQGQVTVITEPTD